MIYLIIYLFLVVVGNMMRASRHGEAMHIHAGWGLFGSLLGLTLLTAGGAFQPIFAALAG